jgi:hypothetical protein
VKAKQLAEVREVVNSEDFRSWFDALGKARMHARETQLRNEELLTQVHLMEFRSEMAQKNATDTLYRAASYDDAAAEVQAEATDLENKSLELVGEFERQRGVCSDLWSNMSAVEQQLDQNPGGRSADARLRRLREDYERETVKKNRLWEDVEGLWGMSLEKNLAVVENQAKSRRVRKESEVLFAAAELSKYSALALKQESEAAAREQERAQAAVKQMMAKARSHFETIVHEDFLYWPQRDNNKRVFVTPLFNDSTNYNIELKACAVYQCNRDRGVAFLEPVVEVPRTARVDTRLDDFFLKGRPQKTGRAVVSSAAATVRTQGDA